MNPYSIPPLMSGLLVLSLGIYSIFNRPRLPVHRMFTAITVAVTVWLVCYAVSFSCEDSYEALFFARVAYLGVAAFPVLSLHFHLHFIKKTPLKELLVPLYLMTGFFMVIAQTDLFLTNPRQYFWGYYPQASVLYPVFLCFFIPVLWAGPLFCIAEIIRGADETALSPIQIKQLKYIVGAFLAASVGMIDFAAKFGIPVYPIGFLMIVLWLVIAFSALNQYRLMDIDMAADMVQRAKTAAVGMLSAGLDHQLSNRLSVIRGQIQMYLTNVKDGYYKDAESESAAARSLIAKIEEQALLMGGLIKKMSRMAKPVRRESGETSIDLGKTINDVLDLILYEVEIMNVSVRKNIQPVPPAKMNQADCEEILFNLLLNACQEMSISGGTLTISAWTRGDYIQIVIEDTGRGISKDKLEHIFDPFYSTGKLGKGAGLGLYLTKQLVDRNKAKLRIESEEWKGTTVIVEFPLFVTSDAKAVG